MLQNVSLEVWRHRKSGDFLVKVFAEDPSFKGTQREIDARLSVSAAEMRERGLEVLLGVLERVRNSAPDVPRWIEESPSAFRKVVKLYTWIALTFRKDGVLEIDPLNLEGMGLVGSQPEDRAQVSLLSDNETFFESLTAALAG